MRRSPNLFFAPKRIVLLSLCCVVVIGFAIAGSGTALNSVITDRDNRGPQTLSLKGEAAIKELKQIGLYDTVIDAVGATPSGPQQMPATATLSQNAFSSISQDAYIKASNTAESDLFGVSIAVSGDTVVVGAQGESSGATGVNGDQSDNSVHQSGAAYVFVRSGTTWSQQAYLKASNTGADDVFGTAIAISGDTIVIGAYAEDSSATGVNGNQNSNSAASSGAAYVFTRSGTTWSQQAYLKASNTNTNDVFGYSVAISGDTVVVGARFESSSTTGVNGDQNDNSASGAGAAYVFVRSGTIWSQQAYLKASNTGLGDNFGISAAISGDTVVVGANRESSNATGVNGDQNDNSAAQSGSAYVFTRSGSTWSQQAYLKASNTGSGDAFGDSLAVSGDTVVVGAHLEASSATGVNGDQSDNSSPKAGAAYVFIRSGTTWSQQAYLKASNTGTFDGFGVSVAVSDDTIVVGASGEASNATGVNGDESDDSVFAAGAAYVFIRSGTTWNQQSYLKASNTDADDGFGRVVAISGDTVLAGADGEDSSTTGVNSPPNNDAESSGAVYLFFRDGSGPTPTPTPNTMPGDSVTVVSPGGEADVTFSVVTTGGNTVFTPIQPPSSAGTPPEGYTILPAGPAFDITTTATYTPPVMVCFAVVSISDPAEFARVRVLHVEAGILIDRTILAPDMPAPDYPTRTVCARVGSLSPFVAALAPVATPTATPTTTPTATPTPGSGFENDVTPRANGDGIVISGDVIQMRRFATGLDTPALDPNEYQRADSAPRATFGDGNVNSGDVIQARRYATGLDPATPASGPTGPTGPPVMPSSLTSIFEDVYAYFFGREIRVTPQKPEREDTVTVAVEITPYGDEVAAGFTLEYDAAKLSNPQIALAEGAPQRSILTINTNETGKIGILVDSSEAFTASAVPKRFLVVTFDIAKGVNGKTRISPTGALAAKAVADANGNTLHVRYLDGNIDLSRRGEVVKGRQ